MVAPEQRGFPIDRTPEYQAFIKDVAAFHEKRGTTFDPEPRIGSQALNLLTLYNAVLEKGGYDKVAAVKLGWRDLALDKSFPVEKSAWGTMSFNFKTAYYKNLAAYEIKIFHGKEPPPKEVLEMVSARGGNLLNRTIESYHREVKKEGPRDTEVSGDDGTPVRDGEEAPGSVGRSTRGLRQAPPQRVLFQPDTQPARQKHAPTMAQTPPPPQQQQPRGASTYNNVGSNGNSDFITNYEPRSHVSLTLRPVLTPGNNAFDFARRQRLAMETANAPTSARTAANVGVMLPGS